MNTITTPIPDGIYTARIEALTMKTTKTGFPMLQWECVVVDGESAGVHFVKRSVLSTDKAKSFMLGEFRKLGIVIQDAADLRNRRTEIEGMLVKFNIATDQNGNVAYYAQCREQPAPEQTAEDASGDAWNKDW